MKLPPVLLLLLLLVGGSRRTQATWYSENVPNGADIIQMDLRWPWWPSGSYFANWNSSFNPKPNNLSFYAGFTSFLEDGPGQTPNPDATRQDAFRPGSVWTFWGSDTTGTPVRFIDVAPNLYIKNDYGGEGSSGTVGGEVWPFIRQKQWYTMLARVWQPVEATNHAFVGRWIKDHADGTWHLIGVARLPIPATSFAANSGFLEPLTSEKAVRSLHRRLGYFRKDGTWGKSDTIAIDKTQYVVVNTVAEADHEYAAIEYAQRPDLLPQRLTGTPISGDRKHAFTTRQPDQPTFDRPSITNARAFHVAGHVTLSWDVPRSASPMLAVRAEVFSNAECTGKPSTIREVRMPSLRHLLLATPEPNPTVRLTLIDVFDQTTTPVVVPSVPAAVPTLQSPAIRPTIPGLAYELRHQDSRRRTNYFNPPAQKPDESHHWLTLAELPNGKAIRTGLARGFDTGVRERRNSGYALTFTGLLRVPSDGPYLFHAQIDGAYRIEIDGSEVLVRDGQWGTTHHAAFRTLSRGDHPIRVTHVYDDLPAHNFAIDWEGPGFSRQPIPLDALRVPDDGAYPTPTLSATARGDGTGRVEVQVDPRGHQVDRIALFLGGLQLAEKAGTQLEYHGPLPAGTNTLWARLVFDGSRTIDSAPALLSVTGQAVPAPWTLRNVGDAKASAGIWPSGTNGFQFFGNGMHTVLQHVTGDFTATCRIDDYNGSRGEPVNHRAWTGLAAREFGDRLNWEWGQDFHLVQTAAEGLRASADFTDFGAGRITSYELPRQRPWLRIVRKGHLWTAWTSTNGTQWELGAYQFKKARPGMDVGLFFSALPQDARAHYHATVSSLSIVPGVAPDSIPPAPIPARNTDGDRLTGVVMARSNPRIVVLRSTSRGLLRSTDAGKSWSPANGNLTGDDLAVRSVAIHPENPDILFRATGRGTTGHLWKSTNAGQSWARLNLDANFDGVGPSALCGEVIAFDLRDARIVYVGTESKGFFKSTDLGEIWTRLGLVGERITAVVVWPWEKHYPAPARGKSHLCVTTCPDSWMSLLGRGEPAVATTNTVSRGYVSHDDIRTLAVSDERPDTGFFNVAFDKALQSVNEMRYATAHGYQSQVFAGTQMALYPPAKDLEWFRPFTAIAATALGDAKFGRCLTQALDPVQAGRYSQSERWAFEWSWLTPSGDIPAGGPIAITGDVHLGQQGWFLHTDALYFSPDGGRHLTRILDHRGN